MPRQNKDGKYILSASEIGSFTVCPESWRLRSVVGVQSAENERAGKGLQKHEEWTAQYDEYLFLVRGARVVLALLVLAISAFLLMGEYSVILP